MNNMKDLEELGKLMDTRFRIGGFSFGLDGLIGLIPGIGDVSTTAVSFYIIARAFIAGAPFSVVLKMILNVLIETLVGVVPVLGNVFDFIWRANMKNIELMKQYQVDPSKTQRKSTALIVFLSFGLIVLLFGMLYLMVKLSMFLIGFLV